MIKYKDYYIVFEEIPDKVTLAINLTNCQNRCIGCHSPELRENIGNVLNYAEIDKMIRSNMGINCVLFMGEGNDKEMLLTIAKYVKNVYNISVAVYSGRQDVENEFYSVFDYVKVGPYKKEFGPLNSKKTNQKLYQIIDNEKIDITYKFWK
jgi:anaerobic ribonucleoside-triphosphate reductase activating protein